ncbi:MAG: hypothetical protein JWP29_2970, partial [Rhodoferax sp.]|nr:hypothetical protein [Rhodoferax sp.]
PTTKTNVDATKLIAACAVKLGVFAPRFNSTRAAIAVNNATKNAGAKKFSAWNKESKGPIVSILRL